MMRRPKRRPRREASDPRAGQKRGAVCPASPNQRGLLAMGTRLPVVVAMLVVTAPALARPASTRTAQGGRDHPKLEGGIEAVEEQPSAFVGHAHLACGGRDRVGAADALEERSL